MTARPARAVPALLALLAMLLAACSHPAGIADGSSTVRLGNCGSSPLARPGVLVLVCANNGITARDLRWSAWGKPVASAIGTAIVDICAYQDCAYGIYRTAPIVVVATGLVRCPGGKSGYSRVQYVFAGTSPFPATTSTTNSSGKTNSYNDQTGPPSGPVAVRACG